MKYAQFITLVVCSFLSACTTQEKFHTTISYFDMKFSPMDRGDAELYLLKVSNSKKVTIKTRSGLATARPGEYFITTTSGEKLWLLKSVDTDTGEVVIQGVEIGCGG
jgi:hypothetical protein